MPRKKEEENKEIKTTIKKTTEKRQELEKDESLENKRKVVRERIETGPNGEKYRVRETIIEDEEDSKEKMLGLLTNKKFLIGIGVALLVLIFTAVILVKFKPKPVAQYIEGKAIKGTLYQSVNGGDVTLSTTTSTTIKSKVTSKIKEVKIQKGDTVKQGDELIILDSTYASENVKNIENAITSMEKMLELYKRKNEELTIKANCDGYVTRVQVQKNSEVNVGNIMAYYIPTTTFRVDYIMPYDVSKTIYQWQTVNISVANYEGTIQGLVYDVDNSAIAQGYVTIGVYVNDSPVNLSGQMSTGEVLTSTGNLASMQPAAFWDTITLPIYATQEGTVVSGILEEGKKVQKNGIIFTTENNEITSKVTQYENQLIQLRRESSFQANQVNDYVIRATANGVVTSEPPRVGDGVDLNANVVTLATSDIIQTTVKVNAEDIQKINEGEKNKKVIFKVTGTDLVVNGTVVDAEAYQSTYVNTEYSVTVRVNEADAKKNPDLATKNVKVEIVLEESPNTIYIPKGALVLEGKDYYVYVRPKNATSYEKRHVVIGMETEEYIEIKEGINENENVRVKNPKYTEK